MTNPLLPDRLANTLSDSLTSARLLDCLAGDLSDSLTV